MDATDWAKAIVVGYVAYKAADKITRGAVKRTLKEGVSGLNTLVNNNKPVLVGGAGGAGAGAIYQKNKDKVDNTMSKYLNSNKAKTQEQH